MEHKIMLIPDVHLKCKDVHTISGYVANVEKNILRLKQAVIDLGCTEVIFLGDVFDRGYDADISSAFAHTMLIEDFAKAVNGELYGVIGNHIRLKLDTNPELYLIQPHPTLKTRRYIARTTQVIKTPERLTFNGVEILLQHYIKGAKSALEYKPKINSACKHHIGLFHTELVIPNAKLTDNNMLLSTMVDSYIEEALDQLDYAFVGHIHKPLGTFKVGSTIMCVPGSITNTDAGLGSRHDHCQIPILTITDIGDIEVSYYDFDMHLEELTFKKIESSDEVNDKLKVLQGNTKEILYDNFLTSAVSGDPMDLISFPMFMDAQHYTDSDKRAVRAVIEEPTNLDYLLSIYREENSELYE